MDTHKQELLDGLFRRWGSPSEDGELRIRHYFLRADTLNETSRIKYYDDTALSAIREMETAIETLKAYRETLQERYNYLSSAPFQPAIRLRREKQWRGPVTYHLEIYKKYLSGEEVEESHTKYPGTERHTAIADYKAYLKAHPGIIAEMDIEKGKWGK